MQKHVTVARLEAAGQASANAYDVLQMGVGISTQA
jgi:hypothetical protein